jgi:hypothetical protein
MDKMEEQQAITNKHRYREVVHRINALGGRFDWYNSHRDSWHFEVAQTTPSQIVVTEEWAGISGCAPMTIGEGRQLIGDFDLIFLDANVPKS